MSREEALLQTPEHGLATLWRHARQLLAGPERLAVMAADSETLEMALGQLGDSPWQLVSMVVTESSGIVQDQLFGVHAALWVTRRGEELSAAHAELLTALSAAAPSHRGWLVLERTAEASDTNATARAAASAPPDWPIVPRLPMLSELQQQRQAAVLDQLCREAAMVLGRRIEELDQSLSGSDATLTNTRSATPEEQREAEDWLREAQPLLAPVLDDISAWFDSFEDELADQLDGLPSNVDAARVIPAWLDHVVSRAVTRRLDHFHRELMAVAGPPPEGLQLASVAPSMAVTLDSPGRSGRRRAALAAAVGGAGLLAVGGLWLTSLAALSGGLAVAGARPARHRDAEAWLEPTRRALRGMRVQCEAACAASLLPGADTRVYAERPELLHALRTERDRLLQRRQRLLEPSATES